MKVALLAEGVDRNLDAVPMARGLLVSPSSRRAWIEIMLPGRLFAYPLVALLAEGVDRNMQCVKHESCDFVALLAEGVDRNWMM